MERTSSEEGELLVATERLRQGLEGRSLRATLRLYLLGLATLTPVAALIGYGVNSQTLFLITPILATLLVINQYRACYLPSEQNIEKIRTAVKYVLYVGILILVICVFLDFKFRNQEATLWAILMLLVSFGLIWLFLSAYNSVATINEPTFRSALAILILVSVVVIPGKLLNNLAKFNWLSPGSPPASSLPSMVPRSNTHRGDRFRINNVSKISSAKYAVEGVSATRDTKVWLVVHREDGDGYWVQQPAQVNSSGEWHAIINVGGPGTTRGRRFEVRAFVDPIQPLKPGTRISGWPEAQNEDEAEVIIP